MEPNLDIKDVMTVCPKTMLKKFNFGAVVFQTVFYIILGVFLIIAIPIWAMLGTACFLQSVCEIGFRRSCRKFYKLIMLRLPSKTKTDVIK